MPDALRKTRLSLAAPLILVTLGGCLSTLTAGYELGSSQSSTGARSAGSGSTAATGGASGASSIGTTASGSGGTGTTAVGSSTTGGRVSGTSSGGSLRSDGGCTASGDDCKFDSECCSLSCDGVCRESAGEPCLLYSDCSTENCVDQVCACSEGGGDCGTASDCCNGITCSRFSTRVGPYSYCCNEIGGSCQGDGDCCDDNCLDGGCACRQLNGWCLSNGDCCQGECVETVIVLRSGEDEAVCLNGPGESCQTPADCYNGNCIDGGCGSCSLGVGICDTNATIAAAV